MDFLKVKNWRKYQHYKDRCPPWIKLHSKILDKPKWRALTDSQKGQLAAIWVLAARLHHDPNTDAVISGDPAYLSALTGCKITDKSLQTLIDKGYFIPCAQDASGTIAECSPETETETETEAKTETDGDFDSFWKAYPKKKAKGEARKAWKQMTSSRPSNGRLVAKVLALAGSKEWKKDGGEFIPHPATWLRAEGWDDELAIDRPSALEPIRQIGTAWYRCPMCPHQDTRAEVEEHIQVEHANVEKIA